MQEEHSKINRRNFFKTMGAAGLGGSLVLTGCDGGEKEKAVDPNASTKTEESKQRS
jgi:hypothetical protein